MTKFKMHKKGISLVELLMSIALLTALIGAVYTIFSAGGSTWMTTETNNKLQESLRQTILRVSKELRETGSDKNGVMQVTIINGGGPSGTDQIRFSMPVTCHSGDNLLDSNGDVAYWGAPLTWGCLTSSCMDADDSCLTTDYKYIQYEINVNNQLVRKVLNPALTVVRQDILAQDITDFQASLSVDNNVITLTVTGYKLSEQKRVVTQTKATDIFLRNRG